MDKTVLSLHSQSPQMQSRITGYCTHMAMGLPGGSAGKSLPATWETWVQSLGWEDPLEKGTATHSSKFAWRIPCTEEPGGLQSMGSQRVRHSLATNTHIYVNASFSICPTLSLPCRVKSILYVCVSIPTLQIVSSVPFF